MKVAEETASVPSVRSLEESPIVTSSVGSESRTIAKVAAPDGSEVDPLIALTVIPAVSSSVFVTDTSPAFRPSYAGSVEFAAAVMIEYA